MSLLDLLVGAISLTTMGLTQKLFFRPHTILIDIHFAKLPCYLPLTFLKGASRWATPQTSLSNSSLPELRHMVIFLTAARFKMVMLQKMTAFLEEIN
jgi:hypothetical protein